MANNAKLTGIDALSVISKSDAPLVYALSEQQIEALLGLLPPLNWTTRWGNLPNDFDFKEFTSELENTLMQPLDICQLVADCILDPNSPTRQALIDALRDTENPILPPYISIIEPSTIVIEPSPSTSNLISDCDYDLIFGLCQQIIDMTFTLVIDAYELIELASNAIEASAIIGDDVPFLGASIEFIDFIQETAYEAYTAYANTEKRDELSCELFCLAIGNCELSISSVYNFFASKYLLPFPNSLESLLSQIALLATGEDIFNASNALFWACVLDGYKWLGIQSSSQVERLFLSFFNDPNPDWSTLCPDCFDPISLVGGYGLCGSNGCGSVVDLTNIGTSPIDPTWTRYTFKVSANTGLIRGYPYGASLQDSDLRNFRLRRWGFHANSGGGTAGVKCVGTWQDENLSFETNGNVSASAIQLVSNTLTPTYYIDVTL